MVWSSTGERSPFSQGVKRTPPAPGATADDQLATELTAYLRERIAGYKLPRRFKFDADLPRTPTGKLVKRELQRRYG